MIDVVLWAFDKRKNSTKLPNTDGATYQGELKRTFTVTGLDVSFDFGSIAPPIYNYCHIPSLRRYYFITEWSYSGGLWFASCAVDVLGTYRTEINNSRQYVLRSYSNYDYNLIDLEYPTSPADITRSHATMNAGDFWGGNVSTTSGTVVLGVVGKSSGAVGAVSYYAMSFPVFTSFMSSMLTDITWAGTVEISQDLLKALVNPMQYVVSCRWYPILYASLTAGTSVTSIGLGWWNFALSGSALLLNTITSAWIERTGELAIPKHPQAQGRNIYLNSAPYSTYMLKFLPFGVFEIDTTELYDKAYMGFMVSANLMTGDATLHVTAKTFTGMYDYEDSFLVTEGQIGVTLPVGQVSFDTSKIVSGINLGKNALSMLGVL